MPTYVKHLIIFISTSIEANSKQKSFQSFILIGIFSEGELQGEVLNTKMMIDQNK